MGQAIPSQTFHLSSLCQERRIATDELGNEAINIAEPWLPTVVPGRIVAGSCGHVLMALECMFVCAVLYKLGQIEKFTHCVGGRRYA
jgi:hypothetical protein